MERMLATPADAEIILRLYELRTEAEMRKARAWMTGEFWPTTADEFFAVASNPADPHNAWLRQVLTYWEMAAAGFEATERFQRSCLWIATPRDSFCWPSLRRFWKESGRKIRGF